MQLAAVMADAPAVPAIRRRYAIGDFSGWADVRDFVRSLIEEGAAAWEIGLIGLGGGDTPDAVDGVGTFRPLPAGAGTRLLMCAGEALSQLLALPAAGAREGFAAILERWLMPAHARRLAEAVEAGRVLVWVEVPSDEYECGICLDMLRRSGRAVQIHDFDAV